MITVNARPRSSSGAPRWMKRALQTTAAPFPNDAITTAGTATRHHRDPVEVEAADPEPVDEVAGDEAPERQPEPARSEQGTETDVARLERDLRERHLGHVDRADADGDDIPDDED